MHVAKARADYEPVTQHELAYRTGSVINVIGIRGDLWWLGIHKDPAVNSAHQTGLLRPRHMDCYPVAPKEEAPALFYGQFLQ